MPRSVLQVVAVIIAICAVSGFVLGLRGAPDRARLPGESSEDGRTLNATDAKPLGEPAFIPPPPEPELQKAEDEKPEEAAEPAVAPADKEVAEAAKAAAAAPKLVVPPPTVQEDRVGDLIDGLTPPPEQPPY